MYLCICICVFVFAYLYYKWCQFAKSTIVSPWQDADGGISLEAEQGTDCAFWLTL